MCVSFTSTASIKGQSMPRIIEKALVYYNLQVFIISWETLKTEEHKDWGSLLSIQEPEFMVILLKIN